MTLPTRTRAAILIEQRKPLVVDEIELPQVLEAGQVLVKIHVSGICGSQLGEIDGVKGEDRFLPHLLGHEGAATVLAIGPGVRQVKAGETVVVHWRKGLGIDASVPTYGWKGRRLNAGWVTTFNEHAVVSENRLTPIPGGSDLEVAALFGCAVTTGFGAVINDARLTVGESVVIFGAGGVGLSMVQAASLVSAYPIVAVDRYDNRLALAGQLGATHLVNATSENARDAIIAAVGRAGPDVFIDNTGIPDIIRLGYDVTKPQGRIVLVGVPRHDAAATIATLPLHFGKQLIGSHGGGTLPQLDIPRYHALHRAGRLPLKSLVTGRYPLDGVNDAIAAMREGRVGGRCLLTMA